MAHGKSLELRKIQPKKRMFHQSQRIVKVRDPSDGTIKEVVVGSTYRKQENMK